MSKQNKFLLLIFIILFVVIVTVGFVVARVFFGVSLANISGIKNNTGESEEIVRSPIHEKETYSGPDENVEYFIDDNGNYVPDYETVEENEYDPALFYAENDRVYYDSPSAQYGIDVSSHQEDIDWEAVAADGIDYAILRAAYRGYGQGTLGEDSYFRQNAEGALAAGLDIGAYVFSQAITVEEAIEEAEYILSVVADYDLEYPIVFDWEPIPYDTARTDNITNQQLTEFADAFCTRIEEAGYKAAVYFNVSQGYMEYDLECISQYEVWLADYDELSDFYYDFDMWQYSCEGQVNGVTGPCDMNISFKNYAA
ncbi:MAG: lysozyme [Ruminococcaceae bacterium]|nr:lysozyme [Oscillospiraceae bacterium]